MTIFKTFKERCVNCKFGDITRKRTGCPINAVEVYEPTPEEEEEEEKIVIGAGWSDGYTHDELIDALNDLSMENLEIITAIIGCRAFRKKE